MYYGIPDLWSLLHNCWDTRPCVSGTISYSQNPRITVGWSPGIRTTVTGPEPNRCSILRVGQDWMTHPQKTAACIISQGVTNGTYWTKSSWPETWMESRNTSVLNSKNSTTKR